MGEPEAIAAVLLDGFDKHYRLFRATSAEAKARFETSPSSRGHGRAEARMLGSVVDFLSALLS